ncbi:MAG: histidine ammonia-lyase [Anaerolineales bacterium]
MPAPLSLDGQHLTLDAVATAARDPRQHFKLAPEARERMHQSQAWVEALIERGEPVYGINTGFGIFSDRRISRGDTQRLQRNLILSHSVGLGEPFEAEVVRAAMLIRANTLALGHSGARPAIVDTLLAMLEAGVTPIIPSQGSLGSSGDLAPLSQLALTLSRDESDREDESGRAWYAGQTLSGQAAMAAAGIPRLILGPKESLALNNGATFSAALGALAIEDARRIIAAAEAGLALTLEALRGAPAAFDERLHAARGHPGQAQVAEAVRRLVAGSTLVGSAGRVQDAYSIRCAPQVMGPALDILGFAAGVLEREINSATDNPLLFDGQAISGGNFHGEVVGLALDYVSIALSEVGALSERRTARLVDEKLNDHLPPMLVGSADAAGLHSGLMMPQYTAAALALENKTLAMPDSIHSLPTSANQEDHNANSTTAGRHLRQIVANVRRIVAIELFTAAQAVDLRLRQTPGAQLGHGSAAALAAIRRAAAFVDRDQLYGPALEALSAVIQSGELG